MWPQSISAQIARNQMQFKKYGERLGNEVKQLANHVEKQGFDAATMDKAAEMGTEAGAKAHQMGLEFADSVKEFSEKQVEDGKQRTNQRGRGRKGSQGGQGGRGGQGTNGQTTGGAQPSDFTGAQHSAQFAQQKELRRLANLQPADSDVLNKTIQETFRQMDQRLMVAKDVLGSQAGTAGASATVAYQGGRQFLARRATLGLATNGYVVAIVAVVAFVYLSWIFAAALSQVLEDNARERELFNKMREKALLEYCSRNASPRRPYRPFDLNQIPRKAGG